MQETKYDFPSWEQISGECRKIAGKIRADKFKPDVVIALSRGGLVPARIICDMLVIKDLVSIKVDHWGITAQKDGSARLRYPVEIDFSGKNVLIVDDITDTGESLALALEWARKQNPAETKTAVVYHIEHSKIVPDFFGNEIKKEDWIWVVWPWNLIEDMCNILPNDMDNKNFGVEELRKLFEEKHSVKISNELMREALAALEDRLLVRQEPDGSWKKI